MCGILWMKMKKQINDNPKFVMFINFIVVKDIIIEINK